MRARELFVEPIRLIDRHNSMAVAIIVPAALFMAGVISLLPPIDYAITWNWQAGLWLGVAILLCYLLFAVMAVAWHRHIVFGEAFDWCWSDIFRRPVLRYFGGILRVVVQFALMTLLVVPLVAMLALLMPEGLWRSVVAIFAGFIGLLWLSGYSLRCYVILVARALGDDISLGEALNRTEGRQLVAMRFYAGVYALIALLVLVVYVIWGQLGLPTFRPAGELAELAFGFLAMLVLNWVLLYGASILHHFAENVIDRV